MFNNWEIFQQIEDVVVTEEIKDKLNRYYQLLSQENAKYNLTRIIEINEVFEKHFLDSLLFVNEINIDKQKIADVGTGPGFPGLVIKIFFPNTKITLIESNAKKINFLKLVVEELELANIEFINQRAEEFSISRKEEFDIVISRAVAYLDIILEIGVQMLKVGGQYILLKGPRIEQEIIDAKDKPEKMSLKLTKKQVVQDIGFGDRTNLFYSKTKETNKIYPRKYGQIKKDSGINKQ